MPGTDEPRATIGLRAIPLRTPRRCPLWRPRDWPPDWPGASNPRDCPRAANPRAITLATVSPAPVTSNTQRARVGICTGAACMRKRDIPAAPRVTSRAEPPRTSSNRVPTSSRSTWEVIVCFAAASVSCRFGLMTVAPQYLAKSVLFGSTTTGLSARRANWMNWRDTRSETTPLA